jgi:hypothetical protein
LKIDLSLTLKIFSPGVFKMRLCTKRAKENEREKHVEGDANTHRHTALTLY